MITLRLVAQVRPLGNGKFRPEVRIVDPGYGTEDVFLGTQSVASHAQALEAARRLISTASVEEPTMLELPPAWK
jgi:hypothetical protein